MNVKSLCVFHLNVDVMREPSFGCKETVGIFNDVGKVNGGLWTELCGRDCGERLQIHPQIPRSN